MRKQRNNGNDTAWTQTIVLNNDNYELHISNRKSRRGVGLALVTKQGINTKALVLGALTSFEYAQWRIAIRRTDVTITAIYHQPLSPANNITNTAFQDEFTEWVKVPVVENNVIILGDFNMHINNPNDTDANILIDTLEAVGFQQHIDFSTHQLGNTLDQVFTEILNNIRV